MQFRNYFEGRPRGKQAIYYALVLLFAIIVVSMTLTISFAWIHLWWSAIFGKRVDWERMCPQFMALSPAAFKYKYSSQFLSDKYQKQSAELLGGAIRIPTESFDDMHQDPLKEPRFKIFKKLHKYLNRNFPRTWQHSEIVNSYGSLYTIEGSHSDSKPVVLMAHQDVVPVEPSTAKDWTHDAFSGYFDGTRVWGRGALDTKSSLVAILEAAEALLEQGWKPKRTVSISFGFDEELDGSRGALTLANVIRDRYGQDSIDLIIDEGSGVSLVNDKPVGFVSVSEKGYTDINIAIKTPGGHSSVPPDHTGIGIMSQLLRNSEADHTANTEFRLEPNDIAAETFRCLARYTDKSSQNERAKLIDTNYSRRFLSSDKELRGWISTTQAIDVIKGGVKINALPEKVTAIVNYRIDVHESVGEVTDRLVALAKATAKKFSLFLEVNGENVLEGEDPASVIEITNGQSIEPAPISPYDIDDRNWQLLAGTTKHVLEKWFGYSDVIISPLLATGNTDTWRYAGLSNHVYRYTVATPDAGENAHTVNEYINIDAHSATVVWYYELIQFF